MNEKIQLGDVVAEVFRKEIKNIHISVLPPNGRVRISTPKRHSSERVRIYALSKLPWIKKQQRKMKAQAREGILQYVDRESHYVWGRRMMLRVEETKEQPEIKVKGYSLVLRTRANATEKRRAELVEDWYRTILRKEADEVIKKWEPLLKVKVAKLFIRRMKTRWGSCNHSKKTIRLNSELARKPRECLEYLVVHEMAHIIEPTHNERFVAILDKNLPHWIGLRNTLNSLPVRHEDWHY
jgi:predicted metal-dependent hydrolase